MIEIVTKISSEFLRITELLDVNLDIYNQYFKLGKTKNFFRKHTK